jgi:hypothetical protein
MKMYVLEGLISYKPGYPYSNDHDWQYASCLAENGTDAIALFKEEVLGMYNVSEITSVGVIEICEKNEVYLFD